MINERALGHENMVDSLAVDRFALLEEIMLQHGRDVVNLAYSYVKDRMQAEDIAQDAFIKAYTHIDQFESRSSLKTWLYRITVNCAKDYLRSSMFRRLLPTAEPLLSEKSTHYVSTEDKALTAMEKQEIWQAVFQLPIKYREIIILYYREELATSDISTILSEKEATIRTRLKRARNLLEKKLERR